jgi:hypothetical protein
VRVTNTEESHLETPTRSSFVANLRSPLGISAVALLLGLSVEILFHGHPPGISFPIWTILCIVGLFVSARLEGIRPSLQAWLLPIPILFLAIMAAMRLEPLTGFLNFVIVLALMAIWVRSFRARNPLEYGWIDFGFGLAWAPLMSWILPWGVLAQVRRRNQNKPETSSRLKAVLRGVLLALPVLVVFIALLHSADLVFAASVDRALSWLNLRVLAEWVRTIAVVVISGLFLLGAIAASLKDVPDWKPFGQDKSILSPFVGFTETSVVIASVDLLFAIFVGIQFRYLFGGEANITAAGYTYSEYARQGFGELVAVAFLTMAMIVILANWTKIKSKRQRWTFAGLSGAMVALVGAILVSALVRLLLYENAYGFTRLRTYTHVAIVWMGVFFAAFLALLLAGQLRRLPFAAFVGTIGFAVTISMVNVDAFVVQQNGGRLAQSGEIDLETLLWLSEDADPTLVRLAEEVPPEVREELLPQLACRRSQLAAYQEGISWPSYHFSRAGAQQALLGYKPLNAYQVEQSQWGEWQVSWKGGIEPCVLQSWMWIR